MSDTTRNTPACDLSGIREAVCVHTDKITDSCLAKDCIEDLHEPDTATDDNEFFHLEASVVTRELLGAEAVYSLQSKAGSLQVKTHDSYLPEPGEPVRISIRKKDLFFFSEDGKRIEK